MSTTPDPRSAVLRAAGHSEAADLLDSLNALAATEQPEPEKPEDESQPAPTTPAEGAEAARQREAGILVAAMRRDLPDYFEEDR
jgi:hypothetical protein